MGLKELQAELNIVKQARKYGIPLWQHPQFLFLVMGIIIVVSSILSYILGRRYIEDPHIAALFIIVLTLVLLVLAFIIERSFERLAEASRLKSEFVSIVSHQLRAPLSNMKWIADLLVSRKGNANQEEYFLMLKENSSRMQELVNNLLMVSRIEEGGLVTKREEFSFEDLLKEVVLNFQPMIQATNITLRLESPKKIPKVFADPLQIRQVLSNLLDNAIKYTGKTKSAVLQDTAREHLVTMRLKDKGKNLRFEIEDTGVGIPKEDQKYLFQKFFRSGNVLRHETQGSGLGLYIARAIVKRSGGEMGFHSIEHKGSTFWFTIPYAS
ncbi:HAMP domain-containing histidine kinase [Patescibacteria group bacterium]|nr:HAMP domain-containing histidine kinase [Patescibacteria group bacterium]